MILFINDIYNLLPEFLFITLICSIITIAILNKNNYSNKELILSLNGLSVLSLIFIFILYINKYLNNIYLSNFILKDNLTINFIKITIVLISIAVFVISHNYYIAKSNASFEVPIIILFSIFGIITVISSNDLMLLYLALELQSLSIYALVSSKANSNTSAEAGLKYFILGSFISGFLLYGISIIYLITGTTNLKSIELLILDINFININTTVLAIILITISLLFKLSAAPFHNWTPDVFDGSPTAVTLFIATVPKIAIFYLIVNILFLTFYNMSSNWSSILLISGLISIIIGCLGGLYQTKIKRLLAYSTINNMGFILVGLSLNLKESIEVSLFYLIVYIVLNTGLFATLILFIKNRYGKELIYIQELSEIYKSNNTLGIIFGLNLFSLIGLPPLAGFLSKAYILILLVQNNLYSISIFIVIMSVITSVYYLRLIKIVFFNKENWNNTIALNSESSLLIIYAITLFNFGLILHVDYVLKLINIISLNLYY